jgi:hypothetical protein
MQNFNKQQPGSKINIPKTPQNIFIKNGHVTNTQKITQEVQPPITTTKYIDELYSKTFLDDYFEL